jgi:hypothetical protein
MTPCIDYITPAQRLAPHSDGPRGPDYIKHRQISVLYHGFHPTPACDTDVRRTMRRWCIETGHPLQPWMMEPGDVLPAAEDLPALMRRQAA